jgi:DNA-binding NtrC family response regulator
MLNVAINNESVPLDRRIIVVDDDIDFAEAEAEFLESRGFSVKVAHDIASANLAINSFDAQVALIDLRLGYDASGIDLIEELREVSSDLICIMVTGHEGVESAIQALRRGANDYLTKPIGPEELLLVLDRCFETRRLMDEK